MLSAGAAVLRGGGPDDQPHDSDDPQLPPHLLRQPASSPGPGNSSHPITTDSQLALLVHVTLFVHN